MKNTVKTLMITALLLAAFLLCTCRAYADYGFDSREKSDYGFVKASDHFDYTTIKKVGTPIGGGAYYYGGGYYLNSLYYDSSLYYPCYLNGAVIPVFLPRSNSYIMGNQDPAHFSNNAVNDHSFDNNTVNGSNFENNVINNNGFENNVITNGE
ncbi:MAG: hypothetical protein AB2L14_27575 [Candidatus Xenobiia bacterium LiM19]